MGESGFVVSAVVDGLLSSSWFSGRSLSRLVLSELLERAVRLRGVVSESNVVCSGCFRVRHGTGQVLVREIPPVRNGRKRG